MGYLGVARTGELGNAKALNSGTSNRYRFPRFFLLYGLIIIYFEQSGSGESAGYMLLEDEKHGYFCSDCFASIVRFIYIVQIR